MGNNAYQQIMTDLLSADNLFMRLKCEVDGKCHPAVIYSGDNPLAYLKEVLTEPAEIPGNHYPFNIRSITPPDIEGELVGDGISIPILGLLAEYQMPVNSAEEPEAVEENSVVVKRSLYVEITAGTVANVYNINASSLDGPIPYALMLEFTRALGNFERWDKEKQALPKKYEDRTPLGIYQVSGIPVLVTCDKSKENLILDGVPSQKLTSLCLQPDFVKKLELGKYNNSSGRFHLRRDAKNAGIKVID